MIRLTYESTWRHIQTRPNAGAYRYTGDGQHSLGNNDRRMIGGCFNLWGRTERLLQVNTKSIPKDKTPTNQTKAQPNLSSNLVSTSTYTKVKQARRYNVKYSDTIGWG